MGSIQFISAILFINYISQHKQAGIYQHAAKLCMTTKTRCIYTCEIKIAPNREPVIIVVI